MSKICRTSSQHVQPCLARISNVATAKVMLSSCFFFYRFSARGMKAETFLVFPSAGAFRLNYLTMVRAFIDASLRKPEVLTHPRIIAILN